jgi:Cap4 SAVED domain
MVLRNREDYESAAIFRPTVYYRDIAHNFFGLTMPLFDDWCENDEEEDKKKRLWKLTEKDDGRATIVEGLAETVRSHYDSLDRIADDVEELGYEDASAILRERLPRGKKARSGDLGEILASELTEEMLGFGVPIRRMRFKDGREVALRGDDFIGARVRARMFCVGSTRPNRNGTGKSCGKWPRPGCKRRSPGDHVRSLSRGSIIVQIRPVGSKFFSKVPPSSRVMLCSIKVEPNPRRIVE